MAVESIRGCGYRKVGGLYIVGEGPNSPCDRLPYTLHYCPTCGSGIKFTRGLQWVDWYKYAGNHATSDCDRTPVSCSCGIHCAVCEPAQFAQPYGVMFVGESFYTPQSFLAEAMKQGISKRIPTSDTLIPRLNKNLHPGTQILLAFKGDNPVIFCSFRVARIEKLIWKSEATPETVDSLAKAGVTAVVIPDGDVDHDPANEEKLTESEHELRELTDLKKMFTK